MRVGDVLVSVDGKNVQEATLSVALATIEAARRRVRRDDYETSSKDMGGGEEELLDSRVLLFSGMYCTCGEGCAGAAAQLPATFAAYEK